MYVKLPPRKRSERLFQKSLGGCSPREQLVAHVGVGVDAVERDQAELFRPRVEALRLSRARERL